MGDPKRLRKKYQKPSHPWQMARLAEEKPLFKEFGLKNKTELWKMNSMTKSIAIQAKKLIAKRDDKQAQKEKELLLARLARLNLIQPGAPIEAALGLSSKDMLERRLQTQVLRKNLARTIEQARQLITHRHIMVSRKVITSPAYIVSAEEETRIEYAENSPMTNEAHPERPEAKAMPQVSEEKEKIENKNGTEK